MWLGDYAEELIIWAAGGSVDAVPDFLRECLVVDELPEVLARWGGRAASATEIPQRTATHSHAPRFDRRHWNFSMTQVEGWSRDRRRSLWIRKTTPASSADESRIGRAAVEVTDPVTEVAAAM